jgi:serine phosphatase RsbU (regulator of sigma subunit)
MYMTLVLGLYDPPTRCLEFVNAGHHMPVLLRDGRAQRVRSIGRNQPLGIRRGQQFAREFPLGLRPEDRLLFFTDGIWEPESRLGERFGDAGLARALECHARLDGDEMLGRCCATRSSMAVAPSRTTARSCCCASTTY